MALLTGVLLFVALLWAARSGETAWAVGIGSLMVTRSIDALRTDNMKRDRR